MDNPTNTLINHEEYDECTDEFKAIPDSSIEEVGEPIETLDPKQPEINGHGPSTSSDDDKVSENCNWRDHLTEPFVFLYMFASLLSSTIMVSVFTERVCLVDLNYPAEICSNLSANSSVQDEVQKMTNNLDLYSLFLGIVPGALLAIFVGPWSDMYGRIPPIIVGIIGGILQTIGYIIFSVSHDVSAYYALIAVIPGGAFGGLVSVIGGVYSLATEKTKPSRRTLKYALMEGALFMGIVVSGLAAGQIYKNFGSLPVYGTQIGLQVFGLLWVILFINDNRPNKKVADLKTKIKDFFSTERMKDNVRTYFKKRPNHGRAQILLLTLCMCISLVILSGMGSLVQLYCQKSYGWDLAYYTLVQNISAVVAMVVITLMIAFITRKLKLQEVGLGLIGTLSLLAQSFTRAFSFDQSIFFISLAAGSFSGLASLAMRTRISKLLATDEIGKVFSLLAILEALMPTPATAVFTVVYNSTISYYPGMMFLGTGALSVIPLIVFLWLLRLPKVSYNTLTNEGILPETTESKTIKVEDKTNLV